VAVKDVNFRVVLLLLGVNVVLLEGLFAQSLQGRGKAVDDASHGQT
jgi:hypothetical protein